jgi:response regulator NasT
VHEAKIIIADSKDASRRTIKEILGRAGYKVQAEARSAPDLLRKVRTFFPDLVILDSSLEGGSIGEVAGIIEDDNLSNVLVITEDMRWRNTDDFPHIIKPFTEETLLSVVEVCLLYNSKFSSIKQEVDKLKETLNSRKMVEKAKGILMKTLSISENEAYRKMQKQSMDTGISMKELARAVILAYEDNNLLKK